MENLKESNSLKIFVNYNNKTDNIILFYIKNNSIIKAYDYFISKNLRKEKGGKYYHGYPLELEDKKILNLKQFKIEVFE